MPWAENLPPRLPEPPRPRPRPRLPLSVPLPEEPPLFPPSSPFSWPRNSLPRLAPRPRRGGPPRRLLKSRSLSRFSLLSSLGSVCPLSFCPETPFFFPTISQECVSGLPSSSTLMALLTSPLQSCRAITHSSWFFPVMSISCFTFSSKSASLWSEIICASRICSAVACGRCLCCVWLCVCVCSQLPRARLVPTDVIIYSIYK